MTENSTTSGVVDGLLVLAALIGLVAYFRYANAKPEAAVVPPKTPSKKQHRDCSEQQRAFDEANMRYENALMSMEQQERELERDIRLSLRKEEMKDRSDSLKPAQDEIDKCLADREEAKKALYVCLGIIKPDLDEDDEERVEIG